MQTKKQTRTVKAKVIHKPKRGDEHAAEASHKKLFIIFGIITLLIGVGVWFWWFFQNRALPNVAVGNVIVSGKSSDEIRQAISQQTPALSITFDNNGAKTTVAAKDLGIVVDADATVQNVMNARRGNDFWQDAQVWQTTTVPLVLANDPGLLIAYAKQHFPDVFVDAKEPDIVYNDSTETFETKAGEAGKGIDIKAFERSLPDLAQNPRTYTFKITSASVSPLLDESKLKSVAERANSIINQKATFTLDGQEIYHATKGDIASWLNFTPDATQGTKNLIVDQAKVAQYIADKVGPAVASPPVDRKVVVDSASGAQSVIQQGKAGSQIQDIESLSKDIVASLSRNTSIAKSISIASAPFKTVTMTGTGKWIEVDLSRQTATMWLGDQIVQSFLISSGKAATPTEIGEFAIYSKTPMMTMTGTIAGDYFYVPNIKWVSFFDGGEAFHGTYWHHNFGHPMSHGCINMTEADAKTLYDFAPIGTKVIVHA